MGRKLVLLCLISCTTILYAVTFQTPSQESAMSEINAIKLQKDSFISAESTCATWEEALDNAQYLLEVKIEMWFKDQNKSDVSGYVAKAQKNLYGIQSMRGNLYRAFLYVKIEDIMPYSNKDQLVVVSVSNEQKTSVQKIDQPQSSSTPTVAQPSQPAAPKEEPFQLTQMEQEMLSIVGANNIGTYIKKLRSEGKLETYGKYQDMPSTIDCYLFVFDREISIVAYLKKKGQSYVNLKTGKSDQISNYKGCGAYWFQLK